MPGPTGAPCRAVLLRLLLCDPGTLIMGVTGGRKLLPPRPQRFARMKEMVMAKVIDFHIPAIFQKPLERGFAGMMWKGYGVLHTDNEPRLAETVRDL